MAVSTGCAVWFENRGRAFTAPVALLWILGALTQVTCAPAFADNDFIWGVGTHALWTSRDGFVLSELLAVGARSFRDDLFWSSVEQERGVYKFPEKWDNALAESDRSGIRPLLIIGYGNDLYGAPNGLASGRFVRAFAAYAGRVAARYKRFKPILEIWNEWTIDSPGAARQYSELIRAAAAEIRNEDRSAVIIAGGFGPTSVNGALRMFVDAGGLDHIDGISVHPYVHCERERTPDGFLNLLVHMRAILADRPTKPLYITEMGWPTHRGRCGVSEAVAADYLLEAYLIARCVPDVVGLWWYELLDDGRNSADIQQNFGIYTADARPKRAQRIASVIGRKNSSISCIREISGGKESAEYSLGQTTPQSFAEIKETLRSEAER